jgi:hypothetical protein
MKPTLLSLLILLAFVPLQAQTELDALRYSQYGLAGTARSRASGGAFSAVGADMSAGALNPAGFGLLRNSVFTLSPEYTVDASQLRYLDASGTASTGKFRLGGFGAAFTTRNDYGAEAEEEPQSRGLVSYTFAIGYHQAESYERELLAQDAFNPYSSITNRFAERAEGTFYNSLAAGSLEQVAFNLLLIDTIAGTGGSSYFGAADRGQVGQTIQRQEEGRKNEWFFSLGGNFDDRLYIGASVNFQTLRYSQVFNFNEEDVLGLYEFYDPYGVNGFPLEIPMNSLRFTDEFSTTGSGVNGNLGVIVRASDAFRFGLSGQTPTLISLTDEFISTLTHNLTLNPSTGGQEFSDNTGEGTFSYTLRTPGRVTLGGMWQLGKSGFLSADVDYYNYRSARLASAERSINSPGYYAFTAENGRIRDLYRQTLNARLGGELRSGVLRLRAGGAWYMSPLDAEASQYIDYENLQTLLSINGSRKMLTGGIGIRQPNFFLDVSYVYQLQTDKFSPYVTQSAEIFQPTAVARRITHQLMTTAGFTF